MSYYGYVERENASQINWAEVGENLTGVLKKANDDRQAKRNAFDQSTKDFQETLNNAPSGDFKTANAFALNHASDASKTRLIQDRLLKSGLMKDRDYTVARQNLVDGTKQMFGLSEEYQKEYTTKIERREAGKSQELEPWLMGQIEGLGNLTDVKSFINQEDGSVSIGKLVDGPNGTRVLSKNPNDFLTVNQLKNRYKKQYNVFKVGETMAVEADRLGSFINTIRNAGGPEYAGEITKMLDATLRGTLDKNQKNAVDNFEKMERNMINSYLESNPLNALSVLTNYLGVDSEGNNFELTFDAAEAASDPTKLLVKDNGSGTIEFAGTEEQKKLAFEAVQNNFRNQIDREKTISTYTEPKPSATQINQDNKEAQDTKVATNIAQLYYGNDAQVKEAEDYLRGINPNIATIDRTGDNIILTFNDDRADEIIAFRDDSGNVLDQKAWITGSANFFLGDKQKITDIDKIIGLSGIDTSLAFEEESTGFSGGVIEVEETAMEAIMRGLSAKIVDNHKAYVDEDGEKIDDANGKFVDNYKDKMPPGFKLTDEGKLGTLYDKIVSIKRTGEDSMEVDITKPDAVQKILDYIENNIDLVSTDSVDRNLIINNPKEKRKSPQKGRGKPLPPFDIWMKDNPGKGLKDYNEAKKNRQ